MASTSKLPPFPAIGTWLRNSGFTALDVVIADDGTLVSYTDHGGLFSTVAINAGVITATYREARSAKQFCYAFPQSHNGDAKDAAFNVNNTSTSALTIDFTEPTEQSGNWNASILLLCGVQDPPT